MSPPDRRPAIARAHGAVSRAISISLGMVTPGVIGVWLDWRFGWLPALTAVGFLAGLVFGVWRLWRMTRPAASDADPVSDSVEPPNA